MMRWGYLLFCFGFVSCTTVAAQSTLVDFQDLTLPPDSFYNGSDMAGGFTSRGAFFNNSFVDFGGGFVAWSGWAYSNMTDVITPGFLNQYSAYHLPNGGGDASSLYGVAFCPLPGDSIINLPVGTRPLSLRITNTTYAALSMRDGDTFAKKFGGPSGDDPDFYRLIIEGLDAHNQSTGSITFYLADYRFADNAFDYILSQWSDVNLSALPDSTTRLSFALESSDVGEFGINTPTYFAMDNLQVAPVPEPVAAALLIVSSGLGWIACRKKRRSQARLKHLRKIR